MKLFYPAVFYYEENSYTVEFPDLPGCVTQADDLENAFAMAAEVASGWILTSIEDDEEISPPSSIEQLQIEDTYSFINYVSLDIDEYAKKHSTKAIKKTLTIPEWLNILAEKENINFSKELQLALKKKLGLIPQLNDQNISVLQNQLDTLHTLILKNSYQIKPQFNSTTSYESSINQKSNIIKFA